MGGRNRILPILQMRKLRPREGKRTCPGSHSKFVVEPGTESMSPRLCPFPVPQFPSLLKWEQHCPSRYTKDRPSLPAMHICPCLCQSCDSSYPTLYNGTKLPKPTRALDSSQGNEKDLQCSKGREVYLCNYFCTVPHANIMLFGNEQLKDSKESK